MAAHFQSDIIKIPLRVFEAAVNGSWPISPSEKTKSLFTALKLFTLPPIFEGEEDHYYILRYHPPLNNGSDYLKKN